MSPLRAGTFASAALVVVLVLPVLALSPLPAPAHPQPRQAPSFQPRSAPVPPKATYSVAAGYYYHFAIASNGAGTSVVVSVNATAAVDVYVMTQSQYSSFLSTGAAAGLFHYSGAMVTQQVALTGAGTFYLVINNDLAGAYVTFTESFHTVPVNIYSSYSYAPAPTGIADYGVQNSSGVLTPYKELSTQVTGTAVINGIGAFDTNPPSGSNTDGAGLQLNVVLQVNTTAGTYDYWLQDTVTFYTSTDGLYYVDNVWNMSAHDALLNSGLISGAGGVYPSGNQNYYGTGTSTFSYSTPLTIKLPIGTSYSGRVVSVTFGYQHASGGQPLRGNPTTYDTVRITEPKQIVAAAILVDGYSKTPSGNYFENELDFGGDCCAASTTFTSMDSTLTMSYTLLSGGTSGPASVYEFGSDTAEGAYNLQTNLVAGQFTVVKGSLDFGQSYTLRSVTGPPKLTFSYAASDSSSLPSQPKITYTSGGTATTAVLTQGATYSIDQGTTWNVTSTIAGGTGERWSAVTVSGTATSSQAVALTYYHQYLVTFSYSVSGGGAPSPPTLSSTRFGASFTQGLSTAPSAYWVDSGASWSATDPLGGSTGTERWYGQASGAVAGPTLVAISYAHQYALQVTGAISSSQWYGAGSMATYSAAGVFGRSGGAGSRLTSYSVDGGASVAIAPTTGAVVLSQTMNAPHTLSFASTAQYQVSLAGSATASLVSVTSPTISNDDYWYDSGTRVTVLFNETWGEVAHQVRTIATGYSVDGATALPPTTGQTFAVTVMMDAGHAVRVDSVTQYYLSLQGGNSVSVSPPSQTGDGYYNAGSALTITSNYTWSGGQAGARQSLTSYELDGAMASVAREDSGTFAAPTITMGGPHSLKFDSVTQYLQSFTFTDGSGQNQIAPTSLQISYGGEAVSVPGFRAWLDSGTSFTISQVAYQGVDVAPSSPGTYTVTGAGTTSVMARVYDATVKVTDALGLPVSGATVKLTLANGTMVSGATGGDGTYTAHEIPLGTFTGTVQALGSTSQLSGNAAESPVATASVLLGTTSLLAIVVGVVVVLGIAIFALRRMRRGSPSPASQKRAATRPA